MHWRLKRCGVFSKGWVPKWSSSRSHPLSAASSALRESRMVCRRCPAGVLALSTHPSQEYVLGESEGAARRLEVQDAHFADLSERLLDEIALRPGDRVVELGCGPGGFSRRILRRLGAGGVLVAVDSSQGLLTQAQTNVAGLGAARFEPVCADIAGLGPWLDGADAVVARTMLHHVPMVETVLGRLRARLKPGTRVGFLEP